MKPAIATVCLSGSLREKLDAIAAAGFEAVELFENDLIAFPGSPREVRRICDDLGLKIITFQPFRDFEGMPDARRARTFERAKRKFDLMEELGCDLLLVCSSVSPEALGGIDRLAADFVQLGDAAARHKIRVGYEALAWGRHINDYRDAWEVVRRADHPNIGTILDTFHIQAKGTDLSAIRSIPKDKIFLVQVADAPKLQMDYLSWSRHWRCMPFQGDLDLLGFMSALSATGYDGCLSLEIFNDRFRAGSARAVALDGHRSLICLMDDARIDTQKMPERAKVSRVEFIEFTVDEGETASFEKMLRGWGFGKTGVHRTKDVSLWKQGEISIVVNSDKEGFAHSYQISHGTSVCALALRVEDARATLARASWLLDAPHADAIGPGELDIPALRGLGGSLLYFIDDKTQLAHWSDVDFLPTGETGEPTGLMAIDHISQSMQFEEMLTWLLFYTSLLDCRKAPVEAVMDPGGVIQSQAIESGLDGTRSAGLRLVLNGSQSHRTMAAKFINDFFGSGVQHIALNTVDIRKTVRRMVENGVVMLPIPQNYYDDLEARSDFGSEEIAELRSLNIMFDSDSSGVFHQAFTTASEGGFFLEIIQRDGYKGYGAPNSGIRLATQAQFARPAGMPSLSTERA